MIRAAAFDIGETLVDETRVWAGWADALGVTFTSRPIGVLGEARVEGLRVRRDYVLVRPAAREPSRLAETFLTFCRTELTHLDGAEPRS